MFDKLHEKLMKDALRRTGVDTNPLYEGKPRKVLHWIAFTLFPFLTNVAIYMVLFFMLDEVRKLKGFETMILICFMIVIFEISHLAYVMEKGKTKKKI